MLLHLDIWSFQCKSQDSQQLPQYDGCLLTFGAGTAARACLVTTALMDHQHSVSLKQLLAGSLHLTC